MIEAGKLRFRVGLYRVTTIRDPKTGAEKTVSEFVATVWAGIEPISNRKIRTLDQQQVVETLLFTLRPHKDVDVDWQIAWKDRVFTVRAADSTKLDRLLITAEADVRHDRI
ncbi:phage head closure protein [Photorhabdus luminescens]|uniref:Head-tail adaptor protein n=1 Tax=Photorhabdus luminescens subsp. mexicana TaxID=2100167 RepID=A0A4R4J3Z0_PHOLU|nr:phage head closure protein [Photorhabdus luminescens]TDB48076.1 head-tail adaptor protein [Photorhabdus luminescens subsp. mexicana]